MDYRQKHMKNRDEIEPAAIQQSICDEIGDEINQLHKNWKLLGECQLIQQRFLSLRVWEKRERAYERHYEPRCSLLLDRESILEGVCGKK